MGNCTFSLFVVSVTIAFTIGPAAPAMAFETAGELFVDLDARDPTAGSAVWNNSGSLANFSEAGDPVAVLIGDTVPAVLFNGTDDAYVSQDNAPLGLVGQDPTRSIEAWVFNESIAGEETIVAWGKRNGPDGSNMSFNYGTHDEFGAVGHWGDADIGWNDAGGAPEQNQWHHLVYTYDGGETRVYADGRLANSELLGNGAIDTWSGTPIGVASQFQDDGVSLDTGRRGSLALARLRIHDEVLTDAQILNNYNEESGDFVDPPPPPVELVGLWQFDDAGDLGLDSSQRSNHLLPEGGVDATEVGRFGGAAEFDGFDGMLSLETEHPDGVPVGNDPYTIAAWIRPFSPINAIGAPSGIVGWGQYGNGRAVNALRIFNDNGFRHYWWGADLDAQDEDVDALGVDLDDGEWNHVVASHDGSDRVLYLNGELLVSDTPGANDAHAGSFAVGRTCPTCDGGEFFEGQLDDVAIFNGALTASQVLAIMNGDFSEFGAGGGGPALQAGDADRDLDFDQLDLVQVQIAAKYLTGQPATWGEGDWNGAPGGSPDNPPAGDNMFNQLDIITALSGGKYLMGPYYRALTQTSLDPEDPTHISVPEPSAIALLVAGLLAPNLIGRRRRWRGCHHQAAS